MNSKCYSFLEILEMEAVNFYRLGEELKLDDVELYYDLFNGRLKDKQIIALDKYLRENVKWYSPRNVYELLYNKHHASPRVVRDILRQ